MKESDKVFHARMIVQDPLTAEIMADLEKAAMNTAIYAELTDDETRAAALAEVRAIRAFHSKLRTLAQRPDEAE